MRIGIKFCGGCNPYIDRELLARRLIEELRKHNCIPEFFQISGCAAVVVINGCKVGCAEVPIGENTFTICGTELDMVPIPEEDLARATIDKIVKRLL